MQSKGNPFFIAVVILFILEIEPLLMPSPLVEYIPEVELL